MLLINKTLSIIIIRKMYDTAAISGWGNCLRLTSPKLLLCLSLSVSGFLTHTLLHKVCGHQECVSGEALTQQWVSGCAAVRIPLHIHAHSTAALWFHIGIPPSASHGLEQPAPSLPFSHENPLLRSFIAPCTITHTDGLTPRHTCALITHLTAFFLERK